jgi:hypothetical protein
MPQQNKQSVIPQQVRDSDVAALIKLDQVEQLEPAAQGPQDPRGDTVMTDNEIALITDEHLHVPPEFDALRDAIFALYALMAKRKAALPLELSDTEREGRRSALHSINEILEWRSLATFSATHLDLLELLIAYWREVEVDGDPRTPQPDGEPIYPQSPVT